MDKKWVIAPKIDKDFSKKFPEINPVVLQLMYNRGLDIQEKIDEFLNPDYGPDIHDPFLFKDMKKAVKKIFKAIKDKKKICVHGDYDADGVCASVLLVSVLQDLGADVEVYIPHRELEGYGMNIKTINYLADKGFNLIITVDCGIANLQEVELAKKKGMEVIITDHHHEPPELPKAVAIINPHVESDKYPFEDLSGVGVAFKLACALIEQNKDDKIAEMPEGYEKWFLDLVAMGTVADCMPLLAENRTLVKYGMVVLKKTRRIGIKKLVEKMGKELRILDVESVGFQLCPRINAAGRMNHANSAYKLLLTKSPDEADKLAEELCQNNVDRQKLTAKIIQEARKQIDHVTKDKKILFALGDEWPIGLAGLVAGRLSDEFHRPVFINTKAKGTITGSGRSIPEFNIIEALEKISAKFSRYGGHDQACGFELGKISDYSHLIKDLEKIASQELEGKDLKPTILIDAQIKLEDVNWPLFENLELFRPFGMKNKKPKFIAKGLNISGLEKVGRDGKHLRIMVNHDTPTIRKTIGFGIGNSWGNKLKVGNKIDMVFEVDVNEWNGNRELQLKIIDLKLSLRGA